MKNRSFCRKLCAVACAVLLLAIAGTALAAPYTLPTYSAYYITSAAINVRSGPGLQHAVIGTVAEGQIVQGLGTSGAWMQIVVSPMNITAYVSAGYLTPYNYLDASDRVVFPVCARPVYNYNDDNPIYVPGQLFYYEPGWGYGRWANPCPGSYVPPRCSTCPTPCR